MGTGCGFCALFQVGETGMAPAASACAMASLRAWLYPPPPQELLVRRMLTPCCFSSVTLLKQRTASEVEPLPLESRNLSDISLTLQLIPAMPSPLSAAAPIVPATCVPWPKSSDPPATQQPLMHVNPCELPAGFTQRLAC